MANLVIPTPQKPRRIELATNVMREENIAAVAIYPGMLAMLTSTGQVQPHTTSGGAAMKRFVVEEALVSRNDPAQSGGVSNVNTQYAIGALVPSRVYRAGDRINALLVAGQNYPVGTKLMSDGAGRLTPVTSTNVVLAEVDEFGGGVNLTATGAVDTLCSVRLW
jgi:hypothetical protein